MIKHLKVGVVLIYRMNKCLPWNKKVVLNQGGGGAMAPLAPPPWIRYWDTDRSVLCHVPTLFIETAEVWNKQFNWPVYAEFRYHFAIEFSSNAF